MKYFLLVVLLALVPIRVFATSNNFNSDYFDYVNQFSVISNLVSYTDWAKANGAYEQLGAICQKIYNDGVQYQNAGQLCEQGTNLIIEGSQCSSNCDSDANRYEFGVIVDQGIAKLNQASAQLYSLRSN